MGNDSSQLSGLETQEKPTEVTDFWSHYQATITDSCRYFSLKGDGSVSVFKGETVLGPLWAISTPLEKFSNNLLKYRHPCIVRYISAWQQRSTLHLATEFVQPLAQVLGSQTPLQICIGLNNILRALVFLHEQAGMSHNNVCVSSIYVTGDGQWKLGALQYLCPFSELTTAYLKHARIHRYDKAVDPSEESYQTTCKVDQYGYAVLVEDVFRNRKDDDVPHLREFKKYCHENLQHQDSKKRPNLSEALKHSFFNHEFITIYKFLNFLPLKSEDERCQFFSNILDNLKCYDEETVAKQLGGLLLSRLTLLDQTARKNVIPYILKPRNERFNVENPGFFNLAVFKEHVKPRLMQLFGVRDSQIRMLLLQHFTRYVHVFTHEELSQHILPELLLGIKDTDDSLVAATLICLSDLVPILGASTVIGGKRTKLFNDGRPNSKTSLLNKMPERIETPPKCLRELTCSEEIYLDNSVDSNVFGKALTLHERPSPIGGDSVDEEIIRDELKSTKAESEDDWSDWDNKTNCKKHIEINTLPDGVAAELDILKPLNQNEHSIEVKFEKPLERSLQMQRAALEAKKNIIDISELDIKNQKYDYSRKSGEEFDFFADMTPTIETPSVVSVVPDELPEVISKLNFIPDETDGNDGWEDSWNE